MLTERSASCDHGLIRATRRRRPQRWQAPGYRLQLQYWTSKPSAGAAACDIAVRGVQRYTTLSASAIDCLDSVFSALRPAAAALAVAQPSTMTQQKESERKISAFLAFATSHSEAHKRAHGLSASIYWSKHTHFSLSSPSHQCAIAATAKQTAGRYVRCQRGRGRRTKDEWHGVNAA